MAPTVGLLGGLLNLIKKLYRWFWKDLMKRDEPFTHTMRQSAKEHPKLWIGIPIGIGVAYYLLVCHLWGLW